MGLSSTTIARLTVLALLAAGLATGLATAGPPSPALAQGVAPSGPNAALSVHEQPGQAASASYAPNAPSVPSAPHAPLAPSAPSAPSAVPATPQWPAGDLPEKIRDMLVDFYGKRAQPNVSDYTYRAPRGEAQKTAAWKDPDTLWEYYGGDIGETSCHGAVTDGDFIDCTGFRLTKTFGLLYLGDLTLFDASRGYYTNDAYAQIAGYYALYHYFALKFDAPNDGAYNTTTARDNKAYHRRMIKAYEAHMRNILVKMFFDEGAKASPDFQASMTRALGLTATIYTAVAQAMEEERIWPKNSGDRSFAIATINGMNQRLFWEWIWPQQDGPRTAGVTGLGSYGTYSSAASLRPSLIGTDAFHWGSTRIESLRPDALNYSPYNQLVVDSDYTIPGEWWCYGAYASTDPDRAKCIAHATGESLGGAHSPFGQFYSDASCSSRPGVYTSTSCGDTSLGSVAEEWTWSLVGARKGMYLVKALKEAGAAQAPSGAVGPGTHDVGSGVYSSEYSIATDRVGYGISGWHGGEGRQDDLEWTWHRGGGDIQAVRTLSAGAHDFETQNGRYSLGESDVSSSSSSRSGGTWSVDRQDYPGGMENHSPGPNPLYGTLLFGLTLWDQVDDPSGDPKGGLSGSFYDTGHRNHPDEFLNWSWLLMSTYYRCAAVGDPLDPSCADFSGSNRKALFLMPDDPDFANVRYRYLWHDPDRESGTPLVNTAYVAAGDPTGTGLPACNTTSGLPWRGVYDFVGAKDSPYMISEGGYGAYNNLVQGLGGFMRVAAHRYPLASPSPDLDVAYEEQRANVLKPWYDESYEIVDGILDLYRYTYGYVPDIENSTCIGPDPTDPASDMVMSWRYGTGATVRDTMIRRAMWYSVLSVWYLWYDSDWLDVDPDTWLAP